MEMARRHRSLPFSPLDAGAGSQRLPLTPLHAAKLNVPHLEASELGTMDVWTMRQLIHTAGLKHADCEDIDALRERARQALAGDQYIAGERQLERDAEEDETPELPECFDENNNGSLELRRTSMRSSTDGLQPASHRRARISAPNATPCIQHCSHRDRESDSDSAEHSERELKRPRLSPCSGQVAGAACASNGKAVDETEGLDQRRLLEATASAAHHSRDPAVTVDMLSPRMLHRLTCCAEEIQLEVECSAEDVDWGVAVSANAATSALFNAVYLSEFIPARIVDRLSWNVGLVHQFVQGYVQCFQAILYLLKQQCVTPQCGQTCAASPVSLPFFQQDES